jgi:hypothetical protein
MGKWCVKIPIPNNRRVEIMKVVARGFEGARVGRNVDSNSEFQAHNLIELDGEERGNERVQMCNYN